VALPEFTIGFRYVATPKKQKKLGPTWSHEEEIAFETLLGYTRERRKQGARAICRQMTDQIIRDKEVVDVDGLDR
jgi:hypothetical protein